MKLRDFLSAFFPPEIPIVARMPMTAQDRAAGRQSLPNLQGHVHRIP
jgi:hypothetical protein